MTHTASTPPPERRMRNFAAIDRNIEVARQMRADHLADATRWAVRQIGAAMRHSVNRLATSLRASAPALHLGGITFQRSRPAPPCGC